MRAMRAVSRSIRKYRRVHSLTRAEMARKAGVSHNTIKHIEEAEWVTHNPHLETLGRLAKATNTSLTEFLSA